MPTLTNPTAKQLTGTVLRELAFVTARKRSQNRRLNLKTVAESVANAVAATTQGAWDCDGGTAASRYPATTVALAVAWFTRLDGTKVVRVRTERVHLKSAAATVTPPYVAGECAEAIIAAGGFPVLVVSRLHDVYAVTVRSEAEAGCPFAKTLYAAPGDPLAWAVYADYLQDADPEKNATVVKTIRDAVGAGVEVK